MAKLRKIGDSWMIDYYDPQGKRIRKCYKKKKAAEAELGKRVSLIAEGSYLDVKKESTTTLGELLDRYEENFKKQPSFKGKRLYLQNFKNHLGKDTLIGNIRYVDLETYRNQLAEKPVRVNKKGVGKPRTTASINREISCLHHVFSKATEWDLVERSPFERKKTLLQKENNARLRYLTEEEIARLLEACAPHLRNIIICALNTGMRKGEILSLKWSQVRNGFIYLQKTKTNEPRQIPINDTMAALFGELEAARGKEIRKTDHVFTFAPKAKKKEPGPLQVLEPVTGNPISEMKKSFATACKKAGLEDFRFHDLRHTFASQLIMRGAGLKDVQELLGHKTLTMTMRYAHLSQEHKKKAVNLLNGLTASQNDFWAKSGQKPETRLSSSSLSH